MRKALTTAAIAAGFAIFGLAGAATAAPTGNSGAHSTGVALVNVDASDAAHWQICGQNVLTQSIGQDCDNRDHIGSGPQSGASSMPVGGVNADVSDAAHWQICGQNVGTLSIDQNCDNTDHLSR